MTTIERLAALHYKYAGARAESSFWAWLNSIGVDPDETALLELIDEIEESPTSYFSENELISTGYLEEKE